jgi:hypothetical protein
MMSFYFLILGLFPLLMLFKQFEHMCIVIVWFIISICENVLIFCANLFVTILGCFEKIIFHNKNIVSLEHLEFLPICINMFWFTRVFFWINTMFNIMHLFDILKVAYSILGWQCNLYMWIITNLWDFTIFVLHMRNNLWFCSFDVWKFI